MTTANLPTAVTVPQLVSSVGQDFEIADTGISLLAPTAKGVRRTSLANFGARVVTERVITDGRTEVFEFDVDFFLDGRTKRVTLGAEDLFQRDWFVRHLGISAIIAPGRDTPDLVRSAIQATSAGAERELTVTHTGWVEVDGEYAYAHAGGLIRSDRARNNSAAESDRDSRKSIQHGGETAVVPKVPIPRRRQIAPTKVSVRLPAQFDDYRLPDPPRGTRRIESLQLVLSLFELGPDRIMYPAIAAIVWCIIDRPRWSLFLYGLTGTFKTTLALLLGSFFAPGLKEDRLISWNSTTNAINATLASAKNVPLIVDEFVPSPTLHGIAAANRKADDVLRAAANGSTRRRCNGNGAVREEKVPQALVIATGERAPAGESLNARLLAIELERGDLGLPELENPSLAQAQFHAQNGRFAEFTALLVEWLAPQYERQRQELHEESDRLREVFRETGLHARQTDLAADLLAAFDVLLTFLSESKVRSIAAHEHRGHCHLRDDLRR